MYELSHTPSCRERMLTMGIMPCLEKLVADDSDSVQTHAAKVTTIPPTPSKSPYLQPPLNHYTSNPL